MSDPSEKQHDPFRPIQRLLVNSSNAQAHRLTFLDALGQASETCHTVAGWAAPPQESRERPKFDGDQFIEQLSKVLEIRLRTMRQMLDAALEWRERGSDGAEYASIATGLVNWEYFQWIVDFQQIPPRSVNETCSNCELFRPEGIRTKCRSCDEIESASKWTACLLGKPLDLSDFQPIGGQPRDEHASDCAVRALNEAIGGDRYGEIWDAITQSIWDLGHALDADQGANWLAIHLIYESYGLRLIYDDDKISHRFHRRLIDLREVPSLLGPLFTQHQRPLTYTVATDVHYVTVSDGAIHDSWNSGRMGDSDQLGRAGRVKFLWIRSDDDELTEMAHSRFNTYAQVRGYDRAGLPWR
ncbi:MAG: hypothetical protein OXE87_07260 [Chloroflexi bacterium]|nr:hypothetical protein [Chloroflexota bacterium]